MFTKTRRVTITGSPNGNFTPSSAAALITQDAETMGHVGVSGKCHTTRWEESVFVPREKKKKTKQS